MSVVVCSALSELLVPGAGLAGSDACSPFLNSRCASPIDRASFGSLLLPKSSTTMSRMNSTFSGPSSMLETLHGHRRASVRPARHPDGSSHG